MSRGGGSVLLAASAKHIPINTDMRLPELTSVVIKVDPRNPPVARQDELLPEE